MVARPGARWWLLAAGWKKAVLRLVPVVVAVGVWKWRTGTEWVGGLVAGPVAGLVIGRGIVAARLRRHRRELERPLSAALAPALGVAPREVEAGLEIRDDFADAPGGEYVGEIVLPDDWAALAWAKGHGAGDGAGPAIHRP